MKFSDINIKNFLDVLKNKFNNFLKFNKVKWIFLTYILIILIGAGLLTSKISLQKEQNISFFEAFFTSVSAFSDTGLVVKTTSTTFNQFGQAIVAILILIGGAGFFAWKIYIFNYIFRFKLSLFQKSLVKTERGANKFGEIKGVIISSLTIFIILIIFSSFVLSFYFYNVPGNFQPLQTIDNNQELINPYKNTGLSIRYAIFHTITALNNAGFDIVGKYSFAPYYSNYFVLIWLIILFVIGGIGYPVIYDIYLYIRSKLFRNQRYPMKFSLFSKISVSTYFIVAIIGISLILIFETQTNNPHSFWNKSASSLGFWGDSSSFNYGTKTNKVFALIFYTFSTRSAGFSVFDTYDLTQPSLIISSLLMFIGSSPSSTGGGIRTTTLAIIILSIWSKILGKKSIHSFKRSISFENSDRASVVFFISLFLVVIALLVGSSSFDNLSTKMIENPLISSTIPDLEKYRTFNLFHLFFEINSAFGTTGLSTGILDYLNIHTKTFLIFIMFIGQLGISSSILIWSSEKNKFNKFEYLTEDVMTG